MVCSDKCVAIITSNAVDYTTDLLVTPLQRLNKFLIFHKVLRNITIRLISFQKAKQLLSMTNLSC